MSRHPQSRTRRGGVRPIRARDMSPRLERQRRNPRQPAPSLLAPFWEMLRGMVRRGLVFTAAAAGVTALLLGGWAAISSSQMFAVTEAEVHGTKHLSRLEVLRAGGIGSHSNLLNLSVGRLEEQIQRLPWVREARVVRRLPGTVRIMVSERRPRCLALAGGQFYFLDAELSSFASSAGEKALDLPVISGLTQADLKQPDDEIASLLESTRDMLALIAAAGPDAQADLSQIQLDRVWGLTVVWDNLPAPVRLGFGDYADRLKNLKQVTSDLKQRGELHRATLIDLSSRRRIVVRLAGSAA